MTTESPKTSGAVAALIEQLSAGSAEQGAFSMDRQKARVKAQEYLLARPEEYVLQLVQAVSLKGARWLTIDRDGDEVRLACNGSPFTLADFEEIYGALLSKQGDETTAARRHLALGLNAALAIETASITVSSGDASGSVTLRMRPGEPDHYETRAEPAQGTVIVIAHRASIGEVLETIISQRLCFADLFIELDAHRVSFGVKARNAMGQRTRRRGRMEAAGGWYPHVDRAVVHFVRQGVVVATHDAPVDLPGLVFVVRHDAVSSDISQADVLRDVEYEAARSLVEELAAPVVNAFVDEVRSADTRPEYLQQARRVLRRAMRKHYRPKKDGGAPPPPWARRLENAVVWPTEDAGHVSLRTARGQLGPRASRTKLDAEPEAEENRQYLLRHGARLDP